jgi:diguanylate cyclase (GGDEF)-like protein/PAS domain S-box-containing protein
MDCLKPSVALSLPPHIANSPSQGFTIYNESDQLVHCNEAYRRFHEVNSDLIVIGSTFEEIIRQGAKRGQYEAAIGRMDEWVRERVSQHQSANGEVVELKLTDGRWLMIVEFRMPNGYVFGNSVDITERKRAAQYERIRSRTLDSFSANEPHEALLESIVRGVEEIHTAMRCSVLLLDSKGRYLYKGAAPSLPDFYNSALDGVKIGAGVGSSGTAAFTGERVIVADIASHPYWAPFKHLAASAGLAACWTQPVRGTKGELLGVFNIYHCAPREPVQADIDLLEQTAKLISIAIERSLSQARLQLVASVFDHAREGITITDAYGAIVDVNEAFTRITGYSREEAIGQNPRILSSGRQDKSFYAAMWSTLNERGSWSGEIWNRRKSGEVFAELVTINSVRDATGKVMQYVSLFTDVTASKEHQKQLEHISHFDALTNLPNRVLFADRLHQAMAQAQRRGQHLAVVCLDLDSFKTINDKHGHDTGDQMLITLAQRMKLVLREGDTIARLGGDEFVAVLTDLENAVACLPLMSRLLAAASQSVEIGELTLQSSASLGVTLYPQGQDIDADHLLRQSDQAMYQAKQAGGNRYRSFDVALDRNIQSNLRALERVREALNADELRLYYQPKVNMRSGYVEGFEALLRWQHPNDGLIPPLNFLPQVEQSDLIVDIGEWVMEQALRQIERWSVQGAAWPVSVNIAARHFQKADFLPRLRAILALHPSVPPALLNIEILESVALGDIAAVSSLIRECQALGVSFSLDDFGTGYSSLSYLKALRADTLKIDQSFVRQMLHDKEDLNLVETIINIARLFKFSVIAEGVETVNHGTLLLRMGCDTAQGYGIARPMPAEETFQWAKRYQPAPQWRHWADVAWEWHDLPLLMAQSDHESWVKQVLLGIEGVPLSLTEAQLLDHHQCRFSHWYDGPGRERFGHLVEFEEIKSVHEQVHQVGSAVIRLHQSGDSEQAHILSETLLDLKQYIFLRLDALQESVRQSLICTDIYGAEGLVVVAHPAQ